MPSPFAPLPSPEPARDWERTAAHAAIGFLAFAGIVRCVLLGSLPSSSGFDLVTGGLANRLELSAWRWLGMLLGFSFLPIVGIQVLRWVGGKTTGAPSLAVRATVAVLAVVGAPLGMTLGFPRESDLFALALAFLVPALLARGPRTGFGAELPALAAFVLFGGGALYGTAYHAAVGHTLIADRLPAATLAYVHMHELWRGFTAVSLLLAGFGLLRARPPTRLAWVLALLAVTLHQAAAWPGWFTSPMAEEAAGSTSAPG